MKIKKQVLIIFLIFIGCSRGGGGPENIIPTLESKVEGEFSKNKGVGQREFLNVLNSIPVIKGGGSFVGVSTLEYKQGQITCVGTTTLKVIYDSNLKKSSVSRSTNKTSGNCSGNSPTKNYKTGKDLNLIFLYNLTKNKNVIISEGTFLGKKAFLISNKEKDQNTIYLLSLNGGSFDSLNSEYSYLGDDGFIKIKTLISPDASRKIDANLIEDTPETGDVLELSEFPLYDLFS